MTRDDGRCDRSYSLWSQSVHRKTLSRGRDIACYNPLRSSGRKVGMTRRAPKCSQQRSAAHFI